jgi:hypothetical protein
LNIIVSIFISMPQAIARRFRSQDHPLQLKNGGGETRNTYENTPNIPLHNGIESPPLKRRKIIEVPARVANTPFSAHANLLPPPDATH